MRQIKFRCWDKKNHKWISFPKEMFEENDETFLSLNVHDENFQLKQFTGLKDKNGKDIYEGDIVNYKGERPTVVWNILSFGLKYHYEEYPQDFDLYYNELEVIGNIYENAGLLAVAP